MRPRIAGCGCKPARKAVFEVQLQTVVTGYAAVAVYCCGAAKHRIEAEAISIAEVAERLLIEIVYCGQVGCASSNIRNRKCRLAYLLLQLQIPLLNSGGLVIRQLCNHANILRVIDVDG